VEGNGVFRRNVLGSELEFPYGYELLSSEKVSIGLDIIIKYTKIKLIWSFMLKYMV